MTGASPHLTTRPEPYCTTSPSDIGVPAILVAVADELLPEFPMVHCGVGAHPDARIALQRALTRPHSPAVWIFKVSEKT